MTIIAANIAARITCYEPANSKAASLAVAQRAVAAAPAYYQLEAAQVAHLPDSLVWQENLH